MARQPSTLDNYLILNTLGVQNLALMKKVQCRSTDIIYTAKIYKDTISDIYARNEFLALQHISGENIVQVIQIVQSGVYTKKSGTQYQCSYILMESLPNGDLYNAVKLMNKPRPEMARFLFSQVLKAVDSVHSAGFACGGLKFENFYIDSNFNVKLTDFSYSRPLDDEFSYKHLQSKYTPPEAFRGSTFLPQAGDIFSAGVILFILQTLNFPFNSSKPLDLHYSQLSKNPRVFWEMHKKAHKGSVLDDGFKNLIEAMLCCEPKIRASLDEVKNHEWLKGEFADFDDFRDEVIKNKDKDVGENDRKNLWRNRLCRQSSGKSYEYQDSAVGEN